MGDNWKLIELGLSDAKRAIVLRTFGTLDWIVEDLRT
jgi:hypothetical protein